LYNSLFDKNLKNVFACARRYLDLRNPKRIKNEEEMKKEKKEERKEEKDDKKNL
jgi:hypothetical protein